MIRTEEFLLLLLLLLLIFLILFLDFIDQDYSRPRYSTQSPLPCVCVTGRLFRAATSKDQFRSFSFAHSWFDQSFSSSTVRVRRSAGAFYLSD